MSLAQRLLSPIVDVRKAEATSLLLMFLYSFFVIASYSIVKPLTRAQYIDDLGAENLPYVLLVSGVIIGFLMQGYTRFTARLPPKSVIPLTLSAVVGSVVGFWALFQADQTWASVPFYLLGQIFALLLISQFWNLANDLYDARQAKRLFGFIGGGASAGGIAGSTVLAALVERVGANTMLLFSAAILAPCVPLVIYIIRRSDLVTLSTIATAGDEKGVGGAKAFRMLRESKHLLIIAAVIAFGAMGAGLLDQQLNMAVEEVSGDEGAAAMARLLAQVQLALSITSLVIQMWLVSRIHRYLGIGVALLILPLGLGASGALILATGALGAAAFGRVLDSALRYSLDKTTREILFLPLPAALRQRVKPFVDVTVDRGAKAALALLILVLIQPWGFGLGWRELSFVTLSMVSLWVFTAVKARQGYLASFRQTIAEQGVEPTDLRLTQGPTVADLSTVETLVEELAHPEANRVLYAIDVLESLDKPNLITPLLLHHESAAVRARALTAIGAARSEIAERWVPTIHRLVTDTNPEVRAAAVSALATMRNEDASGFARSLLDDPDPRIVATAAVVLSASEEDADQAAAEHALSALATDTRESANLVRRDLAAAIRQVGTARCRDLLVPLLHDSDPEVADEAMRSVRALGTDDFVFAPTLVSLLGNRRLKSGARETLVGYGEPVVDVLKYFLDDPDEDAWVRRHLPATLARIPCQRSMDILIDTLSTKDSFLRFKTLAAVEKLRREHPSLDFKKDPIESLALTEVRNYFNRLGLHYNLFVRAAMPKDSLVAVALNEKLTRSVDRLYRLLGLLYPWKDIAASRAAIEHGNARSRAGALEYLDNVMSGQLRHRLVPILENLPLEEKVRRGNVLLKTRPRDVEETLLELINDDDQVVAAAAIALVGEKALWDLRDDVEHVLAHRDVTDWYVFEAASWTLASYALTPERRRERWVEALPTASLVERIRGLPLFASVGIDELFRIAGAGHQTRHDTGTTLFREGAVPEQLHVLLDGTVVATGNRGGSRKIESPASLGFEEALDGCLMSESIKTSGPAVSLTLSTNELQTLLADNTDLVQGLFRTLAARHGVGSGFIRSSAAIDLDRHPDHELTAVQKGLALQRIPLFAKVSGAEMLHLAAIASGVGLEEGEVVADQSTPFGLGILLSGELSLQAAAGPDVVARARPGDVIGMYETLANVEGAGGDVRLVATESGTALRINRDELFDLVGQRPELLQQIFAAIFARGGPPPPLPGA